MNTKRNVWLLAVLGALIIGLGLGSLISGGSANPESTSDGVHVHQEGVSYTCSMHPQINQPEPGSCPICGMALIPAETIAANTDQSAVVGLSDNAQALAQIQTVVLDRKSVV